MKNIIIEKKNLILKTAVTLFADKGFASSKISDLAKLAGVGEATIYNHFKNKKEILISLPIPYIHDFIDSCGGQLKGLKDPEEKIRKFIWHALRWSQDHKKFIKVLLADIAPSPEYYHSEAYDLMLEIPKIVLPFLDEGKDKGQFSKDADGRIFNVFLFGTVAYMLLARIMIGSPLEPLDDFDDAAGAILAAIKNNDHVNSRQDIQKLKDKRERILQAGEILFSQKTSAETTISEIAKTAHVADGTIYDYFKNKENLLFRIFDKRMKDLLETYDDTILPENPETKLKLSVYHLLSWVQNNRPWAKVYIKDIAGNPRFYLSKEHDFMREHDKRLLNILLEGKKKGLFLKSITPEIFLAIFFGPIYIFCIPWALLNQKHSLIAELEDYCTLLFRAIKIKN